MLATRLTQALGCDYPVVQTAMGWVADPKLVAGTCNAGGFGFLAGATIPPEELPRAGRTLAAKRGLASGAASRHNPPDPIAD